MKDNTVPCKYSMVMGNLGFDAFDPGRINLKVGDT
jgi:hypothetical protein